MHAINGVFLGAQSILQTDYRERSRGVANIGLASGDDRGFIVFMKSKDALEKVRLDKWLWAARFFKTRPLASAAISGGKVLLKGQRCKPSRPVVVGDSLEVKRGLELFVVTVEGLTDKRVSAAVAQSLYSETPESVKIRTEQAAVRKAAYAGMKPSERRPTGRERGKIRQFRGKE